MRKPPRPDTQEIKAEARTSVTRDPSYPDRERIDADVRAYMRPVSTPWIVFDRDSRIDDFAKAALRSGAVFMSSPELVQPAPPATPSAAARLADINAMFPPSLPNQKVVDEPSSMIAAVDVVPSAPSLPVAAAPKRNRIAMAMGAVGVAALAAFFITSRPAPINGEATLAAAPPPAVVELPAVVAPAPVEAVATPEPAEVVGENATDPKKRFGKLTIKGDATKSQVWFDGKRMLGKGDRTFLVFCGMHTVAISEKADMKDMEVPCNGELAIGK